MSTCDRCFHCDCYYSEHPTGSTSSLATCCFCHEMRLIDRDLALIQLLERIAERA